MGRILVELGIASSLACGFLLNSALPWEHRFHLGFWGAVAGLVTALVGLVLVGTGDSASSSASRTVGKAAIVGRILMVLGFAFTLACGFVLTNAAPWERAFILGFWGAIGGLGTTLVGLLLAHVRG
jgi:hypothetical protein